MFDQRNMIDRYLDRPDNTFKSGKFAYLDSILQSFSIYTSSQKKRRKLVIS